MNRRFIYYRDCFPFGAMAALSWHLFWFFLIVPDIKISSPLQCKSRAFFLGAILKESDLVFLPCKQDIKRSGAVLKGGRAGDVYAFCPQKNLSKNRGSSDIFQKTDERHFKKGFSPIHKPVVFLKSNFDLKQPESDRPRVFQGSSGFVFGVSDVGCYLNNIDFSDMKNMFLREELSSVMDLKILVNKRGIVVSIVKCIGSGDPALDFYIMRKFKMAILKQPYIQSGWIKVHFKIRE